MGADADMALARPPAPDTALRDGLWVGAALLLLLAWDLGGLDLPLARLYGSAQGFPWRDHWLTGGVLHGGARGLAWVAFGVLLLGLWWPLPFVRALSRRERIWWLAVILGLIVYMTRAQHRLGGDKRTHGAA